MKTTSIITASSILALAIFAVVQINIGTYSGEIPATQVQKLQSKQEKTDLSSLLPFKEETYLHPVALSVKSEPKAATTTPTEKVEVCLDNILFIEQAEPVNLGFNVDEYLPANFDPYAEAGPDFDAIPYIEEEVEIDLGFDTSEYLPEGFDPFANPSDVLDEIVFIQDDAVNLGFDTRTYLPENFDPYAQAEPDLDVIFYIEEEELINIGFDVNTYLPADFDPYAAPSYEDADPDFDGRQKVGQPSVLNTLAGEDMAIRMDI